MLGWMANAPSFSVIMPAYNAAGTLAAAIESLLTQTLAPREILVIDDGSTDATVEIASSYGGAVKVISQPNAGTAGARNRGLDEANGDVIAFLDADDLYTATRLERIAEKFVAEPELEAVATDAVLEYEDSQKLVSSWWPPHARRDRLDAAAPIIFCTLAIRRELIDSLGGFDRRYRISEDLEYWYRIGCRGHQVGYVAEPSYRYRIRASSKTGSSSSVEGNWEFVAINARYAVARRTPLKLRIRLAVRAARHARHALKALARRG